MSEKKIELHVHTKFSNDSLLLENFLLLMCKIKRIDIIVITDHNTIVGAHKIKDKFRKHNIGVIVGEEIFSRDGEIIGLFLNEKIDAGLSADETINQIKKQNGIVYIPHPYDKKRIKSVLRYEKIIKLQDKIDLV